ncbi:MAG: hypothetical protein QW165_02790 [Candidatus Woesearchaeota archaeon]
MDVLMGNIRRIVVIGDAGSGKNYLSEILSSRLGIPFYDFDDLEWERKFEIPRSKNILNQMVGDIVKKDSWIVATIPHSWAMPAIVGARKIVVLNKPVFVDVFRIAQRFFKRKFSANPPGESLRRFLGVLWKKFSSKSQTKELLSNFGDEYSGKIIELNSDYEVRLFLRGNSLANSNDFFKEN